MPFGKFTLYTVLGCLPWTFALAGLGYALGENWDDGRAIPAADHHRGGGAPGEAFVWWV